MTDSPPGDPIADAWAELGQVLAGARAMVARVRAQPLQTREERDYLQREALAGELGRDMQRLARHVEAGETTWSEVFEGTSPYVDLLAEHLSRMEVEHLEAVREALADDPAWDPAAVAPELGGPSES